MYTQGGSVLKKRILKELKDISSQKYDCSIKIESIDDSNFHELIGIIDGPLDTPYENGTFRLSIKLPDSYPFYPPIIKFLTKIWHPNVCVDTGVICSGKLEKEWASSMTLEKALLTIQSILSECEFDETQEPMVARQFFNDNDLFERTARHWTQVYATFRQNVYGRSDEFEFDTKIKSLIEMGCDEDQARLLLSSHMWNLEKVISILKNNILNEIAQFKRWRELFVSIHAT
jgi:ubiquitin-conjugating enzyme (huntingtin interacting protein 2)